MSHSKNSKLLCSDLIDDAIWESTEDILSASAAKYSPEQRIGKNEIGRPFKLSHKGKTKFNIRFEPIERGRVA